MPHLYHTPVFNKDDAFVPKHVRNARTKYVFREDYNLEALPKSEQIVQPKGYKWKAGQQLLQHSAHAGKLPKENFFERIKTYYDEGIQRHEPIQDFGGFGALDLIYNDLYGKPFPYITADPNKNKRKSAQERHQIAHKPYRFQHNPFLETIGRWVKHKTDGITYTSTVPLDDIYKHFRQDAVPVRKVATSRLQPFVPKASIDLLQSVKRLPHVKGSHPLKAAQ